MTRTGKLAVMHSSVSTEWGTPPDLFARLNAKYSFTLDPAANHENALCDLYCTLDGTFRKPGLTTYNTTPDERRVADADGLGLSWQGHRVFVNPPYGRGENGVMPWVRKAAQETDALVVMLLPVRVGSQWWREYVAPFADVEFLPGRLRFVGAKWPAPFDSAIARYR